MSALDGQIALVSGSTRGIGAAMQHYNQPEPVNLGTGQEISIADLVRLTAAETGFHGTLVWDTSRPNGQPRRMLNVTRAEQEFGFRATTALREGLRATVQWYKANRKGMGAGE